MTAAPPPPAAPDVVCTRRQEALLGWYDRHRRTLPWRGEADPYAVLVSEFMLQQTQVGRVVGRFERFLERFPTVVDLAAAPAAAVIHEWRGLGYNRRAVALHRAAAAITAHHGGTVPDSLDALLGLPGVGPYTARAVLAFGFGHRAAPVDVNVGRVLARAFAGAMLRPREVQRLADDQLGDGRPAADRPGDWSQALMDLGTRHCAVRPRCDGCPLLVACAYRLAADARDPAAPIAGRTPRQARFAGSDRQHRGRLVEALRGGPVATAELAAAAGLGTDHVRAERLAAALVAEGLARRGDGWMALP